MKGENKTSPAQGDTDAFLARFDAAQAPSAPGCYIMRDEKDRPIYVGKAKNLRARIRTYLNESDSRYSVKFLMRRVARIEFLVTATEKEALFLENSLIKEYRPRYNVRLKDDKTYISLRLNPREAFPRVTVVRRYRKDGARYFGPYDNAAAVRKILRWLQRLFPLRTCSDHVLQNRTRPCLYHQMNQCDAPCVGLIDREAYHETVSQVILALEGRNDELEKRLLERIAAHAAALEFEKAAALRDRLYDLRRTLERQRAVAVPGVEDRDVFGLYNEGRFTEIQVLFYRAGKMIGGRSFSFERSEMPLDELLSSLLLQYYAGAPAIPAEVLTPLPLEDAETLGEALSEQRGAKTAVLCPQRGEKFAIVELAQRNARRAFEEKRMEEKARLDVLEQVQRMIHLPRLPHRIECFDISTTQGDKTVASMAVFEGGRPVKARYRRFAMRSVAQQDDFAAMREALMRRLARAIEENDLPDLLLVDGGKGQLGVAGAVLKDLGIEDLPHAAIAKAKPGEDGARAQDRIFIPNRANPIMMPPSHPALLLLGRIRDEAHRFAVRYHRERRGKSALATALTAIPGIGPARARTLLNALGSVARIRAAAVEEIAVLPGFNQKLAEAVRDGLGAAGDAG